MLITRLEEIKKKKFKVYIDEEYAFPLYDKDIIKFHLEEGMEINDVTYRILLEDIVFHRAKQKALAQLKFMDRSENELRVKLSDADYPPVLIDRTISYVTEYGYLNDERYASSYIRSRKERKSKRIIQQELLAKGIKKDIIDNILLIEYQEEEDPERIAIQKAISKKVKNISVLGQEEKQKLIAHLYRKGFELDKIKHVMSNNL